jgi:hypothetical protein
MAVTLNKKLAKELKQKAEEKKGESVIQKLEEYFPTDEEVISIKQRYKSMIKTSQNKEHVGKVILFKIVEE